MGRKLNTVKEFLLLKNYLFYSFPVISLLFLWVNVGNYSISFFYFFSIFTILTSLLAVSDKLMSPTNFVIGYYVLWYVIAPFFASGYLEEQLESFDYRQAQAFLFTTFFFILLSIKIGEHYGQRLNIANLTNIREFNFIALEKIFYLLLIVSTIFVVLVVLVSGGFSVWMASPGDAFLNRAGSGAYVILSHFTSIALGLIVGYIFFETKKIRFLIIFLVWVIITSAVHGSKFQILLLLMVSFMPFLVKEKTFSKSLLIIMFLIVFVFVVGMFFRGFKGGGIDQYLSFFNYFSTLHNFALVIKDISPGEYFTFFYPFNKLLIGLGLADFSYFNINHLLTDIYYPHAWEIRATEQWPLEADLYINFYYVFGLPFVFFYYAFVGLLFGFAQKTNRLGVWFFSFMMTMFLVSHLRDGLYNFNDFYLIPYIAIMAYLFRNYSLDKQA
jgi:hypothetical protein